MKGKYNNIHYNMPLCDYKFGCDHLKLQVWLTIRTVWHSLEFIFNKENLGIWLEYVEWNKNPLTEECS